MEQRSDQWYKARGGLFTASEVSQILKPKDFGRTGETYIYKKVSEKLGVFDEEVTSKSMQWGIDWEYTSKMWYANSFSVELTEPGFVKHPKLEIGCSPDGWIHSELKGLEIKCPYTIDKHIRVGMIRSEAELKDYSDAYFWQCKLSMMIMDCDAWDFASFDPRYEDRLKMFVIELRRNEKEELFMTERIKLATEMRDEVLNKIVK